MVRLLYADDLNGSDRGDVPIAVRSANSFKFLPAASSEMCAAEDVISGGKLIAFGAPPPSRPRRSGTHVSDFSETDLRRSDSSGGKLNGEECRKLKRVSDSDTDSDSGSNGSAGPRKPRPRWYVLVFGSVRVPACMEMKEIRARQRPWSASSPASRESGEWGPWKLLQSLSCKGLDAVVVA